MSARVAAWLAWSVRAVSLLLMAFSLILIALGWSTPLPKGWSPWRDQAINLVGFVGAPALGGLIASRRSGNPYGWLWLGLGLSIACVQLAEPYAAYALVVEPGSLPIPRTVNTVLASGWALMIILLPFVFLMFPTGHLPSRRWRLLAWFVLAAGAVGQAITVVVLGAVLAVFASIILSALSLVIRYYRASGVERQQLKWLALAAIFLGALIIPDLLGVDR